MREYSSIYFKIGVVKTKTFFKIKNLQNNNEIKIKINDLDDALKVAELNVKQQKLINMIEGVEEAKQGHSKHIPANINIQIINNQDDNIT